MFERVLNFLGITEKPLKKYDSFSADVLEKHCRALQQQKKLEKDEKHLWLKVESAGGYYRPKLVTGATMIDVRPMLDGERRAIIIYEGERHGLEIMFRTTEDRPKGKDIVNETEVEVDTEEVVKFINFVGVTAERVNLFG